MQARRISRAYDVSPENDGSLILERSERERRLDSFEEFEKAVRRSRESGTLAKPALRSGVRPR